MKRLSYFLMMMIFLSLSGCMGEDNPPINQESDEIPYTNTQYWNDSHQFNDVAMLVGYSNNTTMHYEISNFTSNITIGVDCDFSTLNGLQGYFQIEIYSNESLIYQNTTSDPVIWEIMVNITSDELHIIIQSEGFDSDPLSEYADYFVMNVINDSYGVTNMTSN